MSKLIVSDVAISLQSVRLYTPVVVEVNYVIIYNNGENVINSLGEKYFSHLAVVGVLYLRPESVAVIALVDWFHTTKYLHGFFFCFHQIVSKNDRARKVLADGYYII